MSSSLANDHVLLLDISIPYESGLRGPRLIPGHLISLWLLHLLALGPGQANYPLQAQFSQL